MFIDKGIIGYILGVQWHGNKQLVSFSLLSLEIYLLPFAFLGNEVVFISWNNGPSNLHEWIRANDYCVYHEIMVHQTCMNGLELMIIVYTNLYSIKQIPIPFNCMSFRFLGLGKIGLIEFCSIWMVANWVRNFISFDVATPFHWTFPLFCFAPTFGIIYHGGRKLKMFWMDWS